MEFLPAITAARSRAVTWTAEQAAANLDKSKSGHTLCERLHSGRLTRLYFDADRWCGDATGAPPSTSESDDFLRETCELLDTLIDVLRDRVPDVGYVLAQRHGVVPDKRKAGECIAGGPMSSGARHKLSLRAFFTGVAIVYHDVPKLLAVVPGLAPLAEHFDMSVYKPEEQLLACVHGCKGALSRGAAADKRVLEPMDPALGPLDFVVQHVGDDWPAIELNRLEAAANANADADADVDAAGSADGGADGGAVVDDRVTRLASCLGPKTARDRKEWVYVGIILKLALGGGTDRYLPAFLVFSRKAALGVSAAESTYKDDDDCVVTWRSFKPHRGGSARRDGAGVAAARKLLGISTLRKYAERDNIVAFAAWQAAEAAAKSARLQVASGRTVGAIGPLALPEACVRQCAGVMLRTLGEDPDALEAVRDARVEGGRLDVVADLSDGRSLSLSLSFQDLEVTDWGADRLAARSGRVHGRDALDVVGAELNSMNKNLQPDWRWQVTSPCEGQATFTTKDGPLAKIDVNGMGGAEAQQWARLEVVNKAPTMIRGKQNFAVMNTAYRNTVHHTLVHDLGLGLALNILGDHNNTQINVFNTLSQPEDERGRDDGLLVEGWVKFFTDVGGAVTPEERGALSIVYDREGSFFFCERGLWVRTGDKTVAANQLVNVMKSVACGRFWDGALNEAERRYIGGLRGRLAVLMCMLNVITDPHFERRLDARLDLVPFDNGVVELATLAFRAMRWDDYVTKTIGYEYVPRDAVPASHFDAVTSFYERVLPVPEEREVFLRAAGAALSGDRSGDKFFLVLTDQRGGNNGKSTLLECVAHVFGALSVPSQANFLYASNNEGSNSHGANDLHYKGRRLAVFDETTSQRLLNTEKIKRITGGGLAMAVRGANDKTPTEFVWTAVVMIGCNEGNMPQFSASEAALLNRMIVVPFRAKFDDVAAAAGEADSWSVDPTVRSRLRDSRAAHFHVLLGAHGRYKAAHGLGRLPATCVQWRDAVAQSSDPRAEAIAEFIDANVDFNPVRTDGQRGHKVLGCVRRTDLVAAIKSLPAIARTKVGELKILVDAAMLRRGRKLCDEVQCGGRTVPLAYKGCVLSFGVGV